MSSEAYKRYALGTLTFVYTLNFVDRGLMSLLLQPIKEDLGFSDTQLGFLSGIAFALFYATLGLPLARWADVGNRVTIASIAIALWGATVMACVFVTNFVQLVFARVAAAVGESGCMPPTYSLVGDYFPASAERARAMSIYMLGGPLSSLISFIVGGWLNETMGWRMTFFLMGIPGLLAAVVVKLTIVEPRRLAPPRTSDTRLPQMAEVFAALWRQRSARHLTLGIVLLWTMGLGLGPWYAAFMMRSHAMRTTELGMWLGLIFGLAGIVGILLGGHVTAKWLAHDERAQMRLCALTIAATVPCYILFLTVPHKYPALLALIPLAVVCNFFFGPTFALLQRLVSDQMRATMLAVVMLLANLIGMGIGPQLVGVLSDLLEPAAAVDSLRYAMLMMSLVSLWSAYHFWRAGWTVAEDLEYARH